MKDGKVVVSMKYNEYGFRSEKRRIVFEECVIYIVNS